ncbi:MAG: ATP-binding protein [Prolixibacteraceae bacterium]|jgi:signal transduction histidine kinase/ligand-binding sensor domain-containing protein/DNA-binding response OmpR family regulator|nr:ATP-binding protein [Prolixibacteraceae bacterium]
MAKSIIYYLTIILFLFAYPLAASNSNNMRIFNNIKVKDGLPVNEVFSITQDSTGFIWMGTINGFVRYDGYEMKLFRKDASNLIQLPDNQITDIVNDGKGGLWIGCYEGLLHFDTRTFKNREINLGGSREVRCLHRQGDSVLWIGTADGLIKLNPETSQPNIIHKNNSILKSNIIRALYTDSDATTWIGTFDGLYALTADNKMEAFDLKGGYKPELKNNLILDIKPYETNNDSMLWIGTETGLVLFNRHTKSIQTFNSHNAGFGNEVVKCIFPVEKGKTFFGSDFGFYFFDATTKQFEVYTHDPFNNYSLANNVVWDIFRDDAGIVWLATSNGISRLNIETGMFQFTPVLNREGNTITGNQINDIYVANNETLWLATKQGVVAIHNNEKKEIFTAESNSPNPLVLNNINTIKGDNLGRIWIGSAGGINIWEPQKRTMHTITASFDINQGLRSNYISAFVTPPDGSFWVSTWGGGMYKARGDFSNIDEIYFEYIANFNTNVIAADKKIWLKHDKRIYTIDLTTLEIEQPEQLNKSIGSNDINSLLIDSDGSIWIGQNNQLIYYNTLSNKTEIIDIFTGKESLIHNLVEDNNGNIWGTTLTTVFKYSKGNGNIESFPMKTGIPLDIFLSQSNAISPSGTIHFGGNDGFISFIPGNVRKNLYAPSVTISGLKINNKEIFSPIQLRGNNKTYKLITYSDELTMKHDQNSVSITFAALHYGNPKRNIYAYKLEGYDKDWNYTTGDNNMASYSYLSPGDYRFVVRGTNNDGVWSEHIASIGLIIKPPFWASAWAIVIYIVILQMLLFMLIITYRNKIRWREEIRTITIEKQKNEQIALAKQQFFTNISHEFRTPLNLISGPVQTLIQKYGNDSDSLSLLNLISKNSRRLLSLVNQLIDLRKIENKSITANIQTIELTSFCKEQYELFTDLANSKKIKFGLTIPDEPIAFETDSEKLESIVQNLLSNAFKFTDTNGKIDFSVHVNKNDISLSVSDSGSGISEEEKIHIFERFYQGENDKKSLGYGIGLNLVREYTQLLNGNLKINSEPGNGSIFNIEFPADNHIAEVKNHTVKSTSQIREMITSTRASNQNEMINTEELPCILIVDDHPETAEFINISLRHKYHLITAPNAEDALKMLNKYPVNAIVTDIMMPGTDGISFCGKVKNDARYEHLPVILLTAVTMDTQQVKGLKAGADAYLTKPFNIDVLDARIESLIAQRQKTGEYIKKQLIIENQEVDVESNDEKTLKKTIHFINQNINNSEINIKNMCREVGVSHSSLYRKIKTQTGMTLNELIRDVKMKKAAQLIKTGKFSIAEVMDETGFTNHSYFAKCFKKEFSCSPRDYAEKK